MTPRETLISIPPAVEGRKVWLRVGAVLDGISYRPLQNANVVSDADVIRFVGDAAKSPAP